MAKESKLKESLERIGSLFNTKREKNKEKKEMRASVVRLNFFLLNAAFKKMNRSPELNINLMLSLKSLDASPIILNFNPLNGRGDLSFTKRKQGSENKRKETAVGTKAFACFPLRIKGRIIINPTIVPTYPRETP